MCTRRATAFNVIFNFVVVSLSVVVVVVVVVVVNIVSTVAMLPRSSSVLSGRRL